MKKPSAQRTALIGLVAGVLAVPALVLAADSLVGSDPAEAQPVAADAVSEPIEPLPNTAATTVAPATAGPATRADVERACGLDGEMLVQKEREGSITDLEQAALDALRPICAEEGSALPSAETPATVETIEASLPVTTSTTVPSDDDDDDSGHGDGDDDSGDSFDGPDDSDDSFDSPDDSADSADSWDD